MVKKKKCFNLYGYMLELVVHIRAPDIGQVDGAKRRSRRRVFWEFSKYVRKNRVCVMLYFNLDLLIEKMQPHSLWT
jgi:hypothetical protein